MCTWCRRVWARSARAAPAWLAAALALAPGGARAGLEQPVDGTRYPTAGVLAHREYRFQARAGPESSLLIGARLGIKDRVQLGVFYGAQHLIERGDVSVNPHVGFEARLRLYEETRWPALAVGFSSQGWGEYDRSLRRYERKSPGFYLVGSKNWHSVVGDLSLHAGGNYSLETDDGGTSPDVFASGDWTIAGHVSILGEFDGALNDREHDGRFGEGGVYLDAGVRVGLGETVSVMLVFSDLTGNFAGGDSSARELEVVFVNGF